MGRLRAVVAILTQAECVRPELRPILARRSNAREIRRQAISQERIGDEQPSGKPRHTLGRDETDPEFGGQRAEQYRHPEHCSVLDSVRHA
jgi:hypothetical protein